MTALATPRQLSLGAARAGSEADGAFHPGGRGVVPAPVPGRPDPARRPRAGSTSPPGRDTLIAAPTGSGKTLAGFLVGIDRLYRAHDAGEPVTDITRVVYVSPLKALAVDIAENLERPLAEIAEIAVELGLSGARTSGSRCAPATRPPRSAPRCCATRRASS